MLKRPEHRRSLVALAALIGLAGCAGFEPAGRNAAPPPPVAAPAPAPVATPAETPAHVPAPAPTRTASNDEDVIVRGQVQRQIPPPAGDPRSNRERIEDIRAWDQCVSHAQASFETDPMRPQLDSPEDVCRGALGMAGREGVPESRRR